MRSGTKVGAAPASDNVTRDTGFRNVTFVTARGPRGGQLFPVLLTLFHAGDAAWDAVGPAMPTGKNPGPRQLRARCARGCRRHPDRIPGSTAAASRRSWRTPPADGARRHARR